MEVQPDERQRAMVPPVISGSAKVAGRLSASTGSWTGTAPLSYRYQWQRCTPGCQSIVGASASSYTLSAGDLGARVRVLVVASNREVKRRPPRHSSARSPPATSRSVRHS
jgi:hypothetical protein